MRVALRADASLAMGTGHLRRCLSLADALNEQGVDTVLVARQLDEVAQQVLGQSAHSVVWLPPIAAGQTNESLSDALPPYHAWAQVTWQQDAKDTCTALQHTPPDWVVIDHYAFDARWHDVVRKDFGCCILVVDDIADRALSPDILLDHNWVPDHHKKYRGRLTREPIWLTGPRFALLSPAYRTAPRYSFKPEVHSLGIFMGGTDPGGITAHVLDCVRKAAGYTGLVEVVSTSANKHMGSLRAMCAAWPSTKLTIDEPNLADFFSRHDLQIGAGGGATWERCRIGVPTIALVAAANQSASIPWLRGLRVLNAAMLPRVPVTELAGEVPPLPDALRMLIADKKERKLLSEAAAALVDGRGAQRASLYMAHSMLRLRSAKLEDGVVVWPWRNHPETRKYFLDPVPIAANTHIEWWSKAVQDPRRHLFIAEVGRLPVGVVRLDDNNESHSSTVSIYLDPNLTGLGLGKLVLRAVQRWSTLRQVDWSLLAIINSQNAASQRIFRAANFQQQRNDWWWRSESC